jgi:hypothetical protein
MLLAHKALLGSPTAVTASIPGAETDRILLEGPHSRRRELWLVLRALRDFIRGFRTLHFLGPCVTVFGSARYEAGIASVLRPGTKSGGAWPGSGSPS